MPTCKEQGEEEEPEKGQAPRVGPGAKGGRNHQASDAL